MRNFHNKHYGETCLLVGNGPSLNATPTELLRKYPSIGANTIHLQTRFMPTYYVAVDDRVWLQYGQAVNQRLPFTAKFVPSPQLDTWNGEAVYYWKHKKGALWPFGVGPKLAPDHMDIIGITFEVVMQAMMQLAYFMGFTTMLMVGVDHTTSTKRHFWGVDEGMPKQPKNRMNEVAEGYRVLRDGFGGSVHIYNLTPNTALDDEFIERRNIEDFL